MLRERCQINTNYETDTFVGLKFDNGDFELHFPLGFNFSADEDELRKEILLLLGVLAHHNKRKDAEEGKIAGSVASTSAPLASYIYLIKDFVQRGYYKECIVEYTSSKRGKINWNRTIKQKKPIVSDGDIIYLDFITKKNVVNENDILTMIHQYCVYKSFWVLGWLFTDFLPAKPSIAFNRPWFSGVLKKKLANTFNDQNKQLFQHMLKIVKEEPDNGLETNAFSFGTNRFEYVWESIIDSVFGIANKGDYFPKTTWHVNNRLPYEMAALEPDTIMLHNNDVFVLDAKYYKFGNTRRLANLPESTSINKQITYGEYIAENERFKKLHGPNMKVYNAFVMPFDAECWNTANKHYIGDAVSSWKHGNAEYENIKGILLDVKHLMKIANGKDDKEIQEMAELILAHC